MKALTLIATLLAAGAAACSEKAPPASPPKPKVEAVKPAHFSMPNVERRTRL